ncbi:uncharacterized protein LOC123384625 [Felis catus]|uniref:uncharacterized protein LOC123384625 n=1 Tax=Felis catus TaxID=9685 RepID=UPI001D19E1B6|nr:uncharacterized protein LOC123384625 [Felis catus]
MQRERESFQRGPSPAEAWGPGRTRAGVLGALGASPRRKAPSRPRAHVLLTLLSVAILCVFPGDWTQGLVVPSSVTDRRLSPGESHRGRGFRIQPTPYSPFEHATQAKPPIAEARWGPSWHRAANTCKPSPVPALFHLGRPLLPAEARERGPPPPPGGSSARSQSPRRTWRRQPTGAWCPSPGLRLPAAMHRLGEAGHFLAAARQSARPLNQLTFSTAPGDRAGCYPSSHVGNPRPLPKSLRWQEPRALPASRRSAGIWWQGGARFPAQALCRNHQGTDCTPTRSGSPGWGPCPAVAFSIPRGFPCAASVMATAIPAVAGGGVGLSPESPTIVKI